MAEKGLQVLKVIAVKLIGGLEICKGAIFIAYVCARKTLLTHRWGKLLFNRIIPKPSIKVSVLLTHILTGKVEQPVCRDQSGGEPHVIIQQIPQNPGSHGLN